MSRRKADRTPEQLLLGWSVRHLRESIGMSRKELARRIGVSDTAVYYIETGQTIPFTKTLAKLAEVLIPEELQEEEQTCPIINQ